MVVDSQGATHDDHVQASEVVLKHAGGAWDASLNHYNTGGGCMVTTQQVDETVYVIGQDDFLVGRYTLDEWAGVDGPDEVPMIECADAAEAWDVLLLLREGCLLWQCEACAAWIFTTSRPLMGVLACSTCGTGGVDFRDADRP